MTHEHFSSPFAFDMALADPVFAMVHRGIQIDQEKRKEFYEEYMTKWEQAQRDLALVSGRYINVNSPKQVIEWLFEDLALPPRYEKKKISTKEDKLRAVLAEVLSKNNTRQRERWIIGALSIMMILRIRGIRKRLSSFLGAPKDNNYKLLDVGFNDSDGRIRQQLRIGGTETGRFSSSKTSWNSGINMQTVPRELRSMFIADEGKVLAEFDLNRGESWVYAHLSNDPEMIRVHQEGGDFHSETASAISSVFAEPLSVDEIIAEKHGRHYRLRYLGKKVNHGSAYRMGEFRQAEVINEEAEDTGITITVAQTRKAQGLWRQKYCMMPEWWNSIERKLNKDRTLETPYGRVRRFYSYWSKDLFKEATSYVPQSTSVDYLNLGMLDVWNDLDQGSGPVQLLHQNHDSILCLVDEDKVDELMPEIQQRLTRTLVVNGHEISIPVEGSFGPSWGEQDEWAAN